MEIKVLTQEEIQQLKNIREQNAQLVEQFGFIEYQLQSLFLQKEELSKNLKEVKLSEITLGKQLQDKYGDGTINLEKGEFIPNPT
jgi:stress response protein YsnF